MAEKMDEPEEARRQYQRAVAGRRPDQPERISDVSALARARLTRLPAPAH
ncbi:MAG TPA: hypothetical protein VN914_11755 [Polyangia bacterium]|nr:hypothetical protein [Polyangia bacterium]